MSISSVKNQGTNHNYQDYNNTKGLSKPDNGYGVDDNGSKFGMDNDRDLNGLESKGNESVFDSDYGDFGLDVEGMSGDDSETTLADEIKELLKSPNLSDDLRKQLTKMATQLSINPKSEEILADQVETLRVQVMEEAVYSPAAIRLNKQLGLEDASAVDAMLRKYGVSDDGRISPETMAKISQDPMITAATAESREAYKGNIKTLQDKITSETTSARDQNTLTDTKDTSVIGGGNPDHHYYLMEVACRRGPECDAIRESATQCAEQTAAIFSAISGTEIKASTDPKTLGSITLPTGGSFNALANKMGGEAIQWPDVELVEFHADMAGDGQTVIPAWMQQSHYPLTCIDDDDFGYKSLITNAGTGGPADEMLYMEGWDKTIETYTQDTIDPYTGTKLQ